MICSVSADDDVSVAPILTGHFFKGFGHTEVFHSFFMSSDLGVIEAVIDTTQALPVVSPLFLALPGTDEK